MTAPDISRDFKGIWIPREIWLDQSLTYFEKLLFSELHSLDGPKGCFASNEYLCNFFNERERKIQDGLSKLKAKGLISYQAFDGRKRTIKTHPEIYHKSINHNLAPQTCEDPELYKHYLAPLPCQKSTAAHYIEKKENTKETTIPPLEEIEKKSSIFGGGGEEKQDQATGITYTKSKGDKKYISESEIFSIFLRTFKTEVIQEAIKTAREETKPINDIFKYLQSICKRLSSQTKLPKKSQQDYSHLPKAGPNVLWEDHYEFDKKEMIWIEKKKT